MAEGKPQDEQGVADPGDAHVPSAPQPEATEADKAEAKPPCEEEQRGILESSLKERIAAARLHRRLKIYWPEDEAWYEGHISDLPTGTEGPCKVLYDDDEFETVDLRTETFEWIEGEGKAPKKVAPPGKVTPSGKVAKPAEKKAGKPAAGKPKKPAKPAAEAAAKEAKPKKPKGNQASAAPPELSHWLGREIEVFWPDDDAWYKGNVVEQNGFDCGILYDDGEMETLDLSKEKFRFTDEEIESKPVAKKAKLSNNPPSKGGPPKSGGGKAPAKPQGHVASKAPGTGGASKERRGREGKEGKAGGKAGKPVEGCELVGRRLKVFWRDDDAWYSGEVMKEKASGSCQILYDDDERETIDLTEVGHPTTAADTSPPPLTPHHRH
ncbi:hypothetical protein CYMTET_56968 [Cymbomonas tetramitiformis]|uniref:Tudor domain-containing protein n=1 Tax=Cymbomonas tetramitiformis TaxID=36881 RepID=A0AAE0BB47_9CHLO|nr:hypothetical protein CYMTET_56968 [Cymbomonas tetramitiformis]